MQLRLNLEIDIYEKNAYDYRHFLRFFIKIGSIFSQMLMTRPPLVDRYIGCEMQWARFWQRMVTATTQCNPRIHTAASEDVAITFAEFLAADGRTDGPQPRNAPRVTHMLPLPVSFHVGDDPPTGDVSLRLARLLPLTN